MAGIVDHAGADRGVAEHHCNRVAGLAGADKKLDDADRPAMPTWLILPTSAGSTITGNRPGGAASAPAASVTGGVIAVAGATVVTVKLPSRRRCRSRPVSSRRRHRA